MSKSMEEYNKSNSHHKCQLQGNFFYFKKKGNQNTRLMKINLCTKLWNLHIWIYSPIQIIKDHQMDNHICPKRKTLAQNKSYLFPHSRAPSIISARSLIKGTSSSHTCCRAWWSVKQRLAGLLSWGNKLIITIIVCWPVCSPNNKG